VKLNLRKLILSTLLASISILALGYTLMVLPDPLHQRLSQVFPDPFSSDDIHLNWQRNAEFVASVRWIGYASFNTILVLTILGFVLENRSLTFLGTAGFLLPIISCFGFSMCFYVGLGILKILWLPLQDVFPYALMLGDLAVYPVLPLLWLFGEEFLYAIWIPITLVGLATLLLGTVTWFYGKLEGRTSIDFWIYKYSRHPQYLGFLITSYGLLMKATRDYNSGLSSPRFPSLPWMISTLVIVYVALVEELEMLKKPETGYREYWEKTPFMLPLPRLISRTLTFPMRRILGIECPKNKWEVGYIVVLYLAVSCLCSLPFIAPYLSI
jgi:protein-S-isoprenylcysteine O-methyltransferase Ste14